jgi:hypothetical protein
MASRIDDVSDFGTFELYQKQTYRWPNHTYLQSMERYFHELFIGIILILIHAVLLM